jgi:hypothetical protein
MWLVLVVWLVIALIVSPVCGRLLASRARPVVTPAEAVSTSETADR